MRFDQEVTVSTQMGGGIGQRTRQRVLRGGAALALLMVGAGAARAQVPSSFDELRARGVLDVGDTVTVEDAAGRKVRGKVDSFDAGTLTLRAESVGGLSEHVFAESEVTRIRRGTKALVKSTLIGAGVALGVTVGGAAAAYGANEGGGVCGGCVVQWSAYTVPVGAGVGALVGFVIDRSTARTIFDARGRSRSVAVAPVVGRGTVGAMASIRF
jgi:hypothetical protein